MSTSSQCAKSARWASSGRILPSWLTSVGVGGDVGVVGDEANDWVSSGWPDQRRCGLRLPPSAAAPPLAVGDAERVVVGNPLARGDAVALNVDRHELLLVVRRSPLGRSSIYDAQFLTE